MNRRLFTSLCLPTLCIIGVALAVCYVLWAVPLIPHVGKTFFFAPTDPELRSDQLIDRLFGKQELVVINIEGEIKSDSYQSSIEKLTNSLKGVAGVRSVTSLSRGPDHLADAKESPLWNRLLLTRSGNSSNIVVFSDALPPPNFVVDIVETTRKFETRFFKPRFAGIPYMIEMLQQKLTRDLVVFSSATIIVFSLVVFLFFRSLRVVLGMLTACTMAGVITLVAIDICKIQVGVLTSNVITIVFILTLSHIVFLTHNFVTIERTVERSGLRRLKQALQRTVTASFLATLTSAIGFASLFFADAKPLRELGVTGAIGAFAGLLCAYLIYPVFLLHVETEKKQTNHGKIGYFFSRPRVLFALLFILTAIVASPGLVRLNTDPSLMTYFKEHDDIRDGLEQVDRNGGSTPLRLAITRKDGKPILEGDGVEALVNLHHALETHADVGSVLSLPILLAEADRNPLTWILSWDYIVDILDDPEYDNVSRSFINKDRTIALYLVRMREAKVGPATRSNVLRDVREIVQREGFQLKAVGGMYVLQDTMARLLRGSLYSGLVSSLPLFILIGLCVTRSVWFTLSLAGAIATVPIILLGVLGIVGLPIDIVTAPAAILSIALGVDEMFHLIDRVKEHQREDSLSGALQRSLSELARPILISVTSICIGFATFSFSTFPPTQRFGCIVIVGTMLAAFSALIVLPGLLVIATRWNPGKEQVAKSNESSTGG